MEVRRNAYREKRGGEGEGGEKKGKQGKGMAEGRI